MLYIQHFSTPGTTDTAAAANTTTGAANATAPDADSQMELAANVSTSELVSPDALDDTTLTSPPATQWSTMMESPMATATTTATTTIRHEKPKNGGFRRKSFDYPKLS
jgi:hypothetical protein